MSTLHGESISVGDAVFDVGITRGQGKVVSIAVDGIEVQFPRGPRVIYNSNGVQSGYSRATLFWRDPVIVIPRRSEKAWGAQTTIARMLNAELKAVLDVE